MKDALSYAKKSLILFLASLGLAIGLNFLLSICGLAFRDLAVRCFFIIEIFLFGNLTLATIALSYYWVIGQKSIPIRLLRSLLAILISLPMTIVSFFALFVAFFLAIGVASSGYEPSGNGGYEIHYKEIRDQEDGSYRSTKYHYYQCLGPLLRKAEASKVENHVP